MRQYTWLAWLVIAALLVARHQVALGQTTPSGPRSPSLDPPAQLMLIRNSLALVNHGNLTGNYTVLRDLASPRFRQRNTAADLAATFAGLREQKLDLSPVLVIQPQLTQAPEIVDDRLQISGIFPTQPQAVQFAIAFEHVNGGWMIDEVSLRIAPLTTRWQPQSPPPASAPPATRSAQLPTPPAPSANRTR